MLELFSLILVTIIFSVLFGIGIYLFFKGEDVGFGFILITGFFFLLLWALIYAFREAEIDNYTFVMNNKQSCYKYPNCQKNFHSMLEDGIIKGYEFVEFKRVLKKEEKIEEKINKERLKEERLTNIKSAIKQDIEKK